MPGTPRRRGGCCVVARPCVDRTGMGLPPTNNALRQRRRTAEESTRRASGQRADMEGTRSVKNVYDRRSLKVDGCERWSRRRVRRELISRRAKGGDAAGFGPRVPLWFACIRNSPCHNFGLLKTCFQMERQERGERWDFNMSCRTSKSSLMWKQQGLRSHGLL